jgi:F0F1-type ATP synthase membrane subunit b/b'
MGRRTMRNTRERTVQQLCGQSFEIVKEGLDEEQVEAFITKLIDERDTLMGRQEHMLSLTKLAERTVAEADKLAEEIKREAEEEARTKANQILAKAEQDAHQVMEQKRGEILAAANREAEAIKAHAQQEAQTVMGQYRQRVQEEIKGTVEKLYSKLALGLEEMMEQTVVLPAEGESKSSEQVTNNLPPADGELPSASMPVTPDQKEAPVATSEADLNRSDVLEQLEQAWVDAEATAGSEEQSPATPSEVAHQPDMGTVSRVELDGGVPISYEGMVELDILPPLAPAQLVEIQGYLRRWPGIGITELRPNNNGYSITVVLDKPIQLIDILKQLPEVENARECEGDKAEMLVDAAPGRDKLKRIAITVSSNK